jgi:hypothetical protein
MADLDADFVKWTDGLEAWYDTASGRWSNVLNGCRFVTLAASLITVVLAAAVDKDYFAGPGHWLIIVSAVLAAASSQVLGQLKVMEMENLREEGRIEASDIAARVRTELPEIPNMPPDKLRFKKEIRELVKGLELKQHRGDRAINGSPPSA